VCERFSTATLAINADDGRLLLHGGSLSVQLVQMASPIAITIDKSGANLAGLQILNVILRYTGVGRIIGIVQSKYLNNIIEQDYCFIKKLARQMKGFKSASATLEGIEVAHMIRKQQFETSGQSAFKQFAALAG
jgi:putative transposase